MEIAVIDTESEWNRVDPTWLHYKGKMFTGVQDACDLYGTTCHYFQREVFIKPPDWDAFDGVIALTNLVDDGRRSFWSKVPAALPRVFLGSGMEYNHVESDQDAGMDLIAGHLLDQGYARIGYFHAASRAGGFGHKRQQAMTRAFERRKVPQTPGLFHCSHHKNFAMDPAFFAPLFDSYVETQRPDAIAFSADDLANYFLTWARQKGLRIPEDIAITGYNDFLLTNWLTTIHYDFHTVGQVAAHALHDMVRGRRPRSFGSIPIPPKLRVRSSSLRASRSKSREDEIPFREMVERGFQLSPDNPHLASTLASRLELTRPYFLRKFRSLFGMEFSSWVSRQRLDRATLFLASTHRPITDLWMEAGFQSAQHFNRLFKVVHGVTPREYREQAAP